MAGSLTIKLGDLKVTEKSLDLVYPNLYKPCMLSNPWIYDKIMSTGVCVCLCVLLFFRVVRGVGGG